MFKLLSQLSESKYQLILDSQDVEGIIEGYNILNKTDITGVIVWAEDGEYKEVWLTESNTPYANDAHYQKVYYYLDN